MSVAFGCATNYQAKEVEKISLGQSKEEITAILGPCSADSLPHYFAKEICYQPAGKVDYFRYERLVYDSRLYYVRFVDGKVEAYCWLDDFYDEKSPKRQIEWFD